MIAIKLAAIERISVEANSVNIQSNIDTIPKINADTEITKNTQLKILIFKLELRIGWNYPAYFF